MTIAEAIHHIDLVKPNAYSQDEKVRWLSTIDSVIKAEIIDTHEGADEVQFQGYDDKYQDPNQSLLVPRPYDDIYIRWMEAQIDYANGEYAKYNNAITLYNAAYLAFEKYYNRTHKPKTKQFTHF